MEGRKEGMESEIKNMEKRIGEVEKVCFGGWWDMGN